MKKRLIYGMVLGTLLIVVSILASCSLPRRQLFQKEITTTFGDTLILFAELHDLKDQKWTYSVKLPSGKGLGVDCCLATAVEDFKENPLSHLKEIHHTEEVNVYQFGTVLFYVTENDILSYDEAKALESSALAFEALAQTKDLCYLKKYFDVFIRLDLPECRALAERWAMQSYTEEEIQINRASGHNTLDMRLWAGEYLAQCDLGVSSVTNSH